VKEHRGIGQRSCHFHFLVELWSLVGLAGMLVSGVMCLGSFCLCWGGDGHHPGVLYACSLSEDGEGVRRGSPVQV